MNENHMETCTPDEIAKARIIDEELDDANFEFGDANDILLREEAAMERAAKKLGLSVQDTKDIYERVSTVCPEQLAATDTVCSSNDLDVARALDEALYAIDRTGLDAMGLLRAKKEATKQVAKQFSIGPAEAERIWTKVESSRSP